MNTRLSRSVRAHLLEQFNTLFSFGEIWLYSGTRVADIDGLTGAITFPSGYIGFVSLPEVPFTVNASGQLIKNGLWVGSRNSSFSGQAFASFQLVDGVTFDRYWLDGSVSLAGGDGAIQFPQLVYPNNTPIEVDSAVFTIANP